MKIKYLYSSFKAANQKKVLSPYLFYLQLKSIDKEFLKGGAIKQIKEHLDYSAASISTQLKKCVKLGYISLYKHDSNKEWKYVLTSYRKVWNSFNKNFSKKLPIKKYRYDVFISEKPISKKDLKSLIQCSELKQNKRNQLFEEYVKNNSEKIEKEKKLLKNINRMIDYHTQTINSTKSEKIKERKKADLKHLISVKQGLDNVAVKVTEKPTENEISAFKSAALLGYKTAMTSVNLSKNSIQNKLFTKKNEKVVVATGITRIQFDNDPTFDRCFWKNHIVYKQKCTVYHFL